MFSPSDLIGTVAPNLGTPLSSLGPFSAFLSLIENSGRGVYTVEDLIEQINQLKAKVPGGSGFDLSQFLTIWSTDAVPNLGDNTTSDQSAKGPDGSMITVSSLKEIIGGDFQYPDGKSVTPLKTSVILSRSPFFSPAARNTRKAEIFLNSMPSTVLSQLVPYLQVDFHSPRDADPTILTGMSQLKFLLGAVQKSSGDANQAMVEAHQTPGTANSTPPGGMISEIDFAGMELFTSPQTMVNPQPNLNVSSNGTRYTEVLDPFRPFASLEHVNINIKPSGHGFVCYKTANMSIKLHDRSRLNEIADLIRVNIFTGITIWMTYGWRAPVRPGQNPYFDYVNDNMLIREAYEIKNSSFSFDPAGQVVINLELFTRGVSQLRDIKISDSIGDMSFALREVKDLIEKISRYRIALKLDQPVGLNKEIRAFQILDAAENGEFPDLKSSEVQAQIASLQKAVNQKSVVDQASATGLITALKALYTTSGNTGKFVFKERYEKLVTSTVDKMFTEVRTGPDPFLPTAGKKNVSDDVIALCDSLNVAPTTQSKAFQKKTVSFGKLFTVFALRGILSLPPQTVDETQIFFYNLNEQCGPISSACISDFPIKMDDFISQFYDLVKTKGSEKITLEDFLDLAVNSQFTDPRAIGYGLNEFYEPWKKSADPQLVKGPNAEQNFQSKFVALQNKYGPFKQPQVEMYVEMSHQRVSEAGETDALQQSNYSAKDASSVSILDAQGLATRKIMRIHVYDKQTNPNKVASLLLKNAQNTGFVQINQRQDTYSKSHSSDTSGLLSALDTITGGAVSLVQDAVNGAISIQTVGSSDGSGTFTSNQQIKDVVSKFVPTIKFGANGSTITSANLASKADAKVSTNNLINSQAGRNKASPNGAGQLGIPMRVIPAQLTMTTFGCPLATQAQNYFIDFNTGTTLDNLYIVTHLAHSFSPGKFETQWTFGYADGYGVYEGASSITDQMAAISPDMGNTSK